MNEAGSMLETALESLLRRIVREELQSLANGKQAELLTPEELAERLKVPRSWVYQQSRQGNIPTHRLGRYIRFNLQEVIVSKSIKS
jgi:excisionase family DNA binding protein